MTATTLPGHRTTGYSVVRSQNGAGMTALVNFEAHEEAEALALARRLTRYEDEVVHVSRHGVGQGGPWVQEVLVDGKPFAVGPVLDGKRARVFGGYLNDEDGPVLTCDLCGVQMAPRRPGEVHGSFAVGVGQDFQDVAQGRVPVFCSHDHRTEARSAR